MDKLKTYLVGSIQDAKDGGTGWRDTLTTKLSDLGFEVQDPCKAECNQSLADNIDDQKKKLENLKRGGAWDRYKETMDNIRQSDLICVNNSKFLIVNWDNDKKHGGTIHEIVEAWQKNIPILTVCYQPRTEMNDWVLGLLLDNELIGGKWFPNFKQCAEYIEKTHEAYIKDYAAFLVKEAKQAEADAKKAAEEVVVEEKKEESKIKNEEK